MDKKDYIVALDLGGSGVKLALGSVVDDTLRVEDIVYQSMPEDGVDRGQITNRQTVSRAISEAVTKLESNNGVRISNLHIGISDKNIKCSKHDYFVYVSRKDGEIVKEDVNMLHDGMNNVTATEGVRILERIPQCYRVYSNANSSQHVSVTDPVGRFGQKLASTFTFVLGSKQMIERYEQTLSELKPRLIPDTITAGPMLAIEAVTTPEEREIGCVVIDLGHDTTDLCICQDHIIRYVRTIPIGSRDINNDIREFGIPVARIESIKCTHGKAMAEMVTDDAVIKAAGNIKRAAIITTKTLASLIECRMKDITNFISQEIADSGYKDKLQAGVILTGGGAKLAGIDKMMERELDMDVRISKPIFNILAADGKEELLEQLENATVIGMLHNAKNHNKYNHVEVIHSISPVKPTIPEARKVEEQVVTPVHPREEVKPEVNPEKPIVANEVKPVQPSKPINEVNVTKPIINTFDKEPEPETEKNQNKWVEKIKNKIAEARKKDESDSSEKEEQLQYSTVTENNTVQDMANERSAKKEPDGDLTPPSTKRAGWMKRLVDAIFPVDLESDEYDE